MTRELAEKVLAACPDAEWRLIFALSRYAGLRCPIGNSQPVAMKHYLQTTEEHFRQAVQEAAQPLSATTCQNPPAEPGPKEEPAIVASGQRVACTGNNISNVMVGAGGLEPPTSSL